MKTCVMLLLALGTGAVSAESGIPAFKLLATRRYVLDNERVLAELRPETVVCSSVQHPLMALSTSAPSVACDGGRVTLSADEKGAEGAVTVSGWLPGAHYSADYDALSAGAAAELVWRDAETDVLLKVRAEPGRSVSFSECVAGKPVAALLQKPEIVPAPPFRLSGVVAGPTMLIVARKDGIVRYLGAVTFADAPDLRSRRFLGSMKFGAGAVLPPEAQAKFEADRAKCERFAKMSPHEVKAVEREAIRALQDFELVPPVVNTDVRREDRRDWIDFAMSAGMTMTDKGRLYCIWHAGGDNVKSHIVGVWSDDGGKTWTDTKFTIGQAGPIAYEGSSAISRSAGIRPRRRTPTRCLRSTSPSSTRVRGIRSRSGSSRIWTIGLIRFWRITTNCTMRISRPTGGKGGRGASCRSSPTTRGPKGVPSI